MLWWVLNNSKLCGAAGNSEQEVEAACTMVVHAEAWLATLGRNLFRQQP